MEPTPEREPGWIREVGGYLMWALIALAILGIAFSFLFGVSVEQTLTAPTPPAGHPGSK